MVKALAGIALLASSVAFGQSKITTVQPTVLPSVLTDYSSKKALVISQSGTSVCPDGYDMYANIPEPRVKPKEVDTRVIDHKNLFYIPAGARLFSTDKQPYLVICVSIK